MQKFALRLRSTQVAEVNELAHDGSRMSQTRVIQADSLHGLKCRKQRYKNHLLGNYEYSGAIFFKATTTYTLGQTGSFDRRLAVPNVALRSCKRIAPNAAAGPPKPWAHQSQPP